MSTILPDPVVEAICRMVSANRKIEVKPVLTLYRDVEWDQVKGCIGVSEVTEEKAKDIWEQYHRGKPVQVITPPYTGEDTNNPDIFKCKGPFYTLVARPGVCACIHLLSIGD